MKLESFLEEQQTYIPRKHGDPTARRMANQIVRNAMKNFHEDDELQAAKKMARGFYNNLLKYIEEIHSELRVKEVHSAPDDVKDVQETTISLSEKEDWNEDINDHGTGMSAICPECGSDEVHTVNDLAGRDRIQAHRFECEDCGHKSGWWGPDSHLAARKYGGGELH